MADQIEGRNPVLELLTRHRRRTHRIWLDQGARPDPRISRILELAQSRDIPVVRVHRRELDERAQGRVHNGVIAHAEPLLAPTTAKLLDQLFDQGVDPLLILADGLSYEHNLGAILRSSLGFGVQGVVVPTRRGAGLSPVVQRVAMGAAEEVFLVREGLTSALKPIRRAGVRVVGADMGGQPLGQVDLRGPLAIVLGGESKGLSTTLRGRCDAVVSIPLAGDLESLNVSVATAVLLYEKRRQDGWFSQS